jgi:hypothetical protein
VSDGNERISPQPGDGRSAEDGLGILLEEERQEVLSQLDEMVSRDRNRLKPETVTFRARHRGLLLPVLINAAALLLILGGVLFLPPLFNRSEQSIVAGARSQSGAEGKLIEAVQQEATQKLQATDQQIAEIRTRYAALNQDRERLLAETEARVQELEKEFQDGLILSLVGRRQELEAGGMARTAIEQQLRELEDRLRGEHARRIEALRQQAEAAANEKEAEAAGYLQEYNRLVQQSRLEREQLERELVQRLKELQSDAAQNQPAPQGENAASPVEDARLQGERALLERMLAAYDGARESVEGSRFDQAVQELEGLREYLSQVPAAELPAVGAKIRGGLFVIDSLQAWIRGAQQGGRPALASAAPAPAGDGVLEAVRQLVGQADRRFQEGNQDAARELYRSALARIPELERSYQRLVRLEAPPRAEAPPPRRDAGAQAQVQAQAARIQELESSLADLQEDLQVSRSRLETADAERRRFRQALEAQRSAAAVTVEPAEPPREELLNLVQAKLKTKEILGSEPIRSQNPGLSEKLNRYFEEFEKISRTEGRKTALREVVGILDRLLEQKSGGRAAVSSARARTDLYGQFLDRLGALLE